MSNIEKVKSFIAKWEAMDYEGVVDTFDDNPVYHNMPMEPFTSKGAIREFIDQFTQGVIKVEWELLYVAENENGVVLTERIDTFVYPDRKLSLPVMGAFEFSRDKIVRWRDYFHMKGEAG